MVFSLFDHRHFSQVLRHERIAALFSEEAEIQAMLRFEAALALVEGRLGVIPKPAGAAIADAASSCRPDPERLAAGVRRDALIVPTLVQILREAVGDEHAPHVHHGATSQDVIDTGLVLRLREALSILGDDLSAVIQAIDRLDAGYGKTGIMGRTRMQRALPITFGDRLRTWRSPLDRHRNALDELKSSVLAVQFGGPVGTLDKLGGRGADVRAGLAETLDLADPGRAWHTERDRISTLAFRLAQVSSATGKIGQDLVLMAQNEVDEVRLESAGLSSAMPHKRNPVQAEMLVTLARRNAGQLATVGQSMIHEGERSGVAWTLEWMVLPEMVATMAASLTIARTMLDGLEIVSGPTRPAA